MPTQKLTDEHFAAIPGLIQAGFNKRQIAERFGCTAATLQVRCSQRKISLRPPFRSMAKNGRNLRVNKDIIQLYESEAAERGVSTTALVKKLLELIAKDNLFDAVLDGAVLDEEAAA